MLRLSIFLIIFLPICTIGKEVHFGSGQSEIKIRWEMLDPVNPEKGLKPTYLRFSKPVHRFDNASIFEVKPARVRNGSPDFREIVLYPRKSSGQRNVEIVLQDRTIIRVKIIISKQSHVPLSYDFRPQRVGKKLRSFSVQTSQSGESELDIMRSVLEGRIASDVRRKNVNQLIRCKGHNLNGNLFRIYENKHFKVYQIRLRNTSGWRRFKLIPHNMYFRKRDITKPVLKHVDNEIIAARKSVILTLLGDRSTSLRGAKICDVGSQAILINAKKKKRRS